MKNVLSQDNEMRVLVLPATPRDLTLTTQVLSRAGIESTGCADLDALTVKLRDGAGAALVVEEAFSNNGTTFTNYLAEQPSWSDLPVLVLARTGADSTGVAKAMDQYGNVTVLERPARIATLVSFVRSALKARARQYQVRDDAAKLEAARDQLEQRVRERTSQLREMNRKLEEKVSETKAAEERARVLLREIVSAQETERARIARDLHDELGQQITSLRLRLAQLERVLAHDPKALSLIELSGAQAAAIDSQVSFLAWKIRPTTIEDLGLSKALGHYVSEWSRNFQIEADFRSTLMPGKRLLPEIEVNIYRIAQEALNNIAKYAGPATVSVILTITQKHASLIVEDNGQGFDTDATSTANSDGGLGIQGMHERAVLLGGTVEIESTPGTGTTVYVHIPAKFRDQ